MSSGMVASPVWMCTPHITMVIILRGSSSQHRRFVPPHPPDTPSKKPHGVLVRVAAWALALGQAGGIRYNILQWCLFTSPHQAKLFIFQVMHEPNDPTAPAL